MSFKVKATVIGFAGDASKYPCHFQYRPGDEIIYDGESFHGRICPEIMDALTPKVHQLHMMGPRYIEPSYWYPIWYSAVSISDPKMKKYDGVGFSNVFESYNEDRYNMAQLVPPNAFKWPPHPERTVGQATVIMCSDVRTSTMFMLEAVDLSDKGFALPYFRRQMTIMAKILPKQEMPVDQILGEFSEEEKLNIYPALSKELLIPLIEELELMHYVDLKDEKIVVTEKGAAKLQEFIASLPSEDKAALKL